MRVRVAFAALLLSLCIFGVALADTSLNEVFSQLEQIYGLPQGILGKVAYVESGGQSGVCASTSSACGMFQWTSDSWYAATRALYGTSVDLPQRMNPVTSAKVTAFALRQAQNQNGGLIQQAKLDMTLGLYMCHFLGSGGCSKFFQFYMQNPNQSAQALFPREAAVNSSVFNGRTLAGVLQLFAQRLQVSGNINVAGNFSDSNGVSLAYSNADVSSSSFMPRSFVPPPQDPNYTYQTTYAPAQTAPPTAPQSSPPTQSTSPTALPQTSLSPAAQSASQAQLSASSQIQQATSLSPSSILSAQTELASLFSTSSLLSAASSSGSGAPAITSIAQYAQNEVFNVMGTGTGASVQNGQDSVSGFGISTIVNLLAPLVQTSTLSPSGTSQVASETFTQNTTPNFYTAAQPSSLVQFFDALKNLLQNFLAFLQT